MSLSMTVPSGEKALFLITFSAQATCQDTYSSASCYVGVTVDGHGASPGDVIFDAASDGTTRVRFTHRCLGQVGRNTWLCLPGPDGSGWRQRRRDRGGGHARNRRRHRSVRQRSISFTSAPRRATHSVERRDICRGGRPTGTWIGQRPSQNAPNSDRGRRARRHRDSLTLGLEASAAGVRFAYQSK
jgi:hypothetical protein